MDPDPVPSIDIADAKWHKLTPYSIRKLLQIVNYYDSFRAKNYEPITSVTNLTLPRKAFNICTLEPTIVYHKAHT